MLAKVLFIFLAAKVAECALTVGLSEWDAWKLANQRNYTSAEEEEKRRALFYESKAAISNHNGRALVSYTTALNKLADLTREEIAKSLLGVKVPASAQRRIMQLHETTPSLLDINLTIRNNATKRTSGTKATQKGERRIGKTKPTTTKRTTTTKTTTTRPPATTTTSMITTAPVIISPIVGSNLDWRVSGAVSPVKEQGNCGSCWAFASVGVLESRLKIKTGRLVSLSQQNLVDCSNGYGNAGCGGGWMDSAFQYVRDVSGINAEAAYPYKAAVNSRCHFNNSASARNAPLAQAAYYDVPYNGGDAGLIEALKSGPVVSSIDASTTGFTFYSSGVFSDSSCSTEVNHAILVVGYGTDPETGLDYWLVKNSWGTWWGEAGYIRMARGSNTCGILYYPSYPILL